MMSVSQWEPVAWFWGIFEGCDHKLPELRSRLLALSDDRLIEFQHQYKTAMAVLYYPYWRAKGSPTDESLKTYGGDAYASWIVSQGQALFEEVRARPDEVEHYYEMFLRSEACGEFPELKWCGGEVSFQQEFEDGDKLAQWVDAAPDKGYYGDLVALIHLVGTACDEPKKFYSWLQRHIDSIPRA
ncbi:MAG: DUF4240 domain-containing protein [Planctomycetia bacterium]|nr:DUF4240 domain-containing protein [Planctomycetia bacterium]